MVQVRSTQSIPQFRSSRYSWQESALDSSKQACHPHRAMHIVDMSFRRRDQLSGSSTSSEGAGCKMISPEPWCRACDEWSRSSKCTVPGNDSISGSGVAAILNFRASIGPKVETEIKCAAWASYGQFTLTETTTHRHIARSYADR